MSALGELKVGSGTRGRLVDTHAHLADDAFTGEVEAVLQRAAEVGVSRVLAVSTGLSSSLSSVALAQTHPAVFAAVGVHPHEAEEYQETSPAVRELLHCTRVVAVGEIGLDYHRADATREEQLLAFKDQLSWARRLGLPVSIHNRDADADVLEAIDGSGVQAVLHCFSGDLEVARSALALGCYLSIAGNVTFPKATELREVVAAVPLEALLLETDSPVLSPQPRRGRRNEPANVSFVADAVADLRGIPVETLSQAVAENADRVFGWGAV